MLRQFRNYRNFYYVESNINNQIIDNKDKLSIFKIMQNFKQETKPNRIINSFITFKPNMASSLCLILSQYKAKYTIIQPKYIKETICIHLTGLTDELKAFITLILLIAMTKSQIKSNQLD